MLIRAGVITWDAGLPPPRIQPVPLNTTFPALFTMEYNALVA